jgi:flagellar FliJ protein
MVERKTQEKLKEKAWEEYLLEYEADERKEVDELTSFQYSNPAHSEEEK